MDCMAFIDRPAVVLLNRNGYIKRVSEMLSDSSKFEKLDIKSGKAINSFL